MKYHPLCGWIFIDRCTVKNSPTPALIDRQKGYFAVCGRRQWLFALDLSRFFIKKLRKKFCRQVLRQAKVCKFVCIPYLQKTYHDNTSIFNAFNDGLVIPKGQTGKQIHTYIDYETKGIVRDYLGDEYEYHELSGIHMEDTEYSLSMSEEFLRYLLGVQVKV